MEALERRKEQRLSLHRLREGKGIIVRSHILTFGVVRKGEVKPVKGLLVGRISIG